MELLKHINTEIYLINSYPTAIDIEFENNDFIYNGSPINTFINVEAINEHGNRMICILQLHIDGIGMFGDNIKNCTFTNGNKTIDIVTSSIDKIQVPIIITDRGSINITASFTTEEII